MSALSAQLTSLNELVVALFEDLLLAEILGGDVADGAVKTSRVVVLDKAANDALSLLERLRRGRAYGVGFEGLMPALELPVRLRIVGRSTDMGHPRKTDEVLEIAGNELRTIIADDPGRNTLWGLFQRTLEVARPILPST